jgi:putative ABC transport system permease protein
MVSHLPFSHSKSGSDVTAEGVAPRGPGERLIAFTRIVDPKYFLAMQIHLLKGRFFDQRDPAGGPVAIVNETLARRCWPNQEPVGKRFSFGGGALHTVVGVIADMRQTSLADPPDLEAFLPHAQMPGAAMFLVIRTRTDPMRLASSVRAAVRELDKNLPLTNVVALAENVAHSTQGRRFTVALLGAFAVLALVLAAVGIYGVISYSVTRRTHEIGVRMALGAGRGRIAGMVVGRAALLGGAGVALGAAGGLALTRLLRSLLYGVSPTDPAVFAGASVFLLAVAALAGYVPARRAARVDPGVALRHE